MTGRYVARRLVYIVPTIAGLVLLAFVLGDLAPGDPVRAYFQRTRGRPPTEAELALVRQEFGLDASTLARLGDWVVGFLQGDLGVSFSTGRPVTDELLSRLPATLQLAGAAMAVALVVAIPVGVVAALYRSRLVDQFLRVGALLGASLPGFFLAYILIIVFAVHLQWVPSVGRGGIERLILPAVALGLSDSAILARLMRSSLLEVLNEDYLRTARAKGLPEWRVITRHGLMNSLSVVVTEAALTFGFLLAFSAIIEVIFVWPGLGRLLLEAITQRDYPVIQGFVVLAGVIFVVINLVVDLLYVWLDPRVTLSSRRPDLAVS